MNVIEFINDDVLMAGAFTSPSWQPWRAFLKALFGLPMSRGDAALFRECTGRTTPPSKPFRECSLVIGRRGGKSRILALIAVYYATLIDWRPYLAIGEVATVAVIASDRDQAKVTMRYIRGLLRNVPILDELVDVDQVETIRLNNSVAIEVHTARISSPRGRSFAACLADEIAFWRTDDGSTNPDREVLRGIRPGLASLPGSMLLMASSPYAQRGELWETYKRHYGQDDSRVLVWKAPTLTMNPSLDRAIVDEAYADDLQSAAAEYGAEFRSELAEFLPRSAIEACTAFGVRETTTRQPHLHLLR